MTQLVEPAETRAAHARPTRRDPSVVNLPNLALAGVVIAALVLRWTLVDIRTNDFRAFLDPWYQHLRSNGLAGLADVNSNYNSPYLVLLALVGYLPLPELVAIKLISVIFDLVLAFFAFKIIRVVRPDTRWLPVIGTALVLILPTVVLNGSAWGQCDAIYAALCLGSLYFLITRRAWLGCAMFGLAFAFKLQAVFFAPVLLGVLVINRMRLRALLAVPAVFLAALTPALIAGRSLVSQLLVYPAQMGLTSSAETQGFGGTGRGAGRGMGPGTGGPPGAGSAAGSGAGSGGWSGPGPGGGAVGRAGGQGTDVGSGHAFTQNAPTWYSWLPADASDVWKYVGLALAAGVAATFAVILIRRRRRLAPADIALLAATSTLIIPLLLPEMHERYFYLAEVLTVVAVIVGGRAWIVPAAAIQIASLSTYLAYLTGTSYLPLGVAALIALAGAVAAAVLLLRALRHPATDLPARSTQARPADGVN